MKKYIYLMISATLIILAVAMIITWEMYLDDRLNTVSVVVAAKNMERSQVITKADVRIDRIKLEQAVEKPITSLRDVIGKEASQYIAKGNQLVDRMIDRFGLDPNANQLIYSIPREWIYSSPGSLRRKDRVYIYAIPDEKRWSAGRAGLSPAPMSTAVSTGDSAPILSDIVVAFAKDSANQEVKPAANSDKRIDATGSINNIELVMTRAQYSVLEKKYLEGYMFNFAYR